MLDQKVFTIGVYGLTEVDFFNRLSENGIDLFIDIRRRRAVRGSKYSFVNSNRLQKKLQELGIEYRHIIELAPSNEIRQVQKEKDRTLGILKTQRDELADEFIYLYKTQILSQYNLSEIFQDFSKKRLVLFCVEKAPHACHRSIVADELRKQFGIEIRHL